MPKLRNIVVNASSVTKVPQNHEAVSRKEFQQVTTDAVEQAQLIAGLNNALLEIVDHEETPDVLSSPPASRTNFANVARVVLHRWIRGEICSRHNRPPGW